MMLGLQNRFIPAAEDGSKRHTIRGGRRFKPGMRADLYRNPRQKSMKLIFRAPITKVDEITIESYERRQCGPNPKTGNHIKGAFRGPHGESLIVTINGVELDWKETQQFFHADGFREPGMCPSYQALQFWEKLLPFYGQVIHWDYEKRSTAPLSGRKSNAPVMNQ